MPESVPPTLHQVQQRRRYLRLALLGLWALATLGVVAYARELNGVVWGWPVSFWMAAQGAPLLYLWVVWLCTRWMDRLDIAERALRSDEGRP